MARLACKLGRQGTRVSSIDYSVDTYRLTVRAMTHKGVGAPSQVFVIILSVLAAVENLRVNVISTHREKGFLVTWDPPEHLAVTVMSNKTKGHNNRHMAVIMFLHLMDSMLLNEAI